MEQLLPVIVGIVAVIVALKVLKGFVKLIVLGLIVAFVAALYFGVGV